MLSRCISRTVAILGMTAAAASGANAQNAVKIGMVMPMTGTLASAGQQVVADNRSGASGRPRAVNRVPACGM